MVHYIRMKKRKHVNDELLEILEPHLDEQHQELEFADVEQNLHVAVEDDVNLLPNDSEDLVPEEEELNNLEEDRHEKSFPGIVKGKETNPETEKVVIQAKMEQLQAQQGEKCGTSDQFSVVMPKEHTGCVWLVGKGVTKSNLKTSSSSTGTLVDGINVKVLVDLVKSITARVKDELTQEILFNSLNQPPTLNKFPGDEIPIIRGSTLSALNGTNDEIGRQAVLKLMDFVDGYIPDSITQLDKPFLMPIKDVFSIQVDLTVRQSYLWYGSGTSDEQDPQASGAYIFRPNGSLPSASLRAVFAFHYLFGVPRAVRAARARCPEVTAARGGRRWRRPPKTVGSPVVTSTATNARGAWPRGEQLCSAKRTLSKVKTRKRAKIPLKRIQDSNLRILCSSS
ncbi:hypothetical protein KSP39_PZI008083 [Platanthera zijinensis]|uniref:Uncharacterized protein n=1 Tax=Platanthera zijinensis TaxID=2320716 RepID=A0AAP0G8J4_9ASPA